MKLFRQLNRATFLSVLIFSSTAIAGVDPSLNEIDGLDPNGASAASVVTESSEPETALTLDACARLMAAINASGPDPFDAKNLLLEKRRLEEQLNQEVGKQDGIARLTQIQGMQLFERALSLLARGNWEELLNLYRPLQRSIFDNAKIIEETTAEINAMKNSGVKFKDPKLGIEMQALEVKFKKASIPFGEQYGTYMLVATLIESVAAGKGVGLNSHIPLQHRPDVQNSLVFDLKSQTAISAAKRILAILSPEAELQAIPALDQKPYSPSLEQLHIMFKHNIYAIMAKLRRDLAEQKKQSGVARSVVDAVADAYMTGSAKLPEPFRAGAMRLAGIAYNRYMLERYLDKVQAVVDVARVQTATGNVVLISDTDTINLQIKTLLDFDGNAIGNDFLVTFARIGYHTDTWANIVSAVQKKSAEANSPYANLNTRIIAAQKRAAELGGLPYTYEAENAFRAIFAVTQTSYLVIDGFLIYGWSQGQLGPFFSWLLHYFTN